MKISKGMRNGGFPGGGEGCKHISGSDRVSQNISSQCIFLNLLVLFREDFLLLSHDGASIQSLWIMPSKNAENHYYVVICAHGSA